MSDSSPPVAGNGDLGWRLWLAAAGLVVAVVVGVLLDGPLSEPLLRSLAYGLLVVAMVLSAVVAASWWFLLAGVALAAVWAASADGIAVLFVAVVAAPVIVAVLALGVAVGRTARRRMRTQQIASAMAACIVFALAIGALDALRAPTDTQPANPLVVDWRHGSYEGIALRSSTTSLIKRLGRPIRRGANEPASPIGEDYYEIGGPTSFSSPGTAYSKDTVLRFKRRSFFATNRRVYGWVTTSGRAQTPEGVGVGDSRDLVSKRYPQADCLTANEGSEYVTFPLCEVRACSGRLLAFGGDPIKSVWLVAQSIRGWGRCLKPTPTTPAAHDGP
jgi:hypothetical protein